MSSGLPLIKNPSHTWKHGLYRWYRSSCKCFMQQTELLWHFSDTPSISPRCTLHYLIRTGYTHASQAISLRSSSQLSQWSEDTEHKGPSAGTVGLAVWRKSVRITSTGILSCKPLQKGWIIFPSQSSSVWDMASSSTFKIQRCKELNLLFDLPKPSRWLWLVMNLLHAHLNSKREQHYADN